MSAQADVLRWAWNKWGDEAKDIVAEASLIFVQKSDPDKYSMKGEAALFGRICCLRAWRRLVGRHLLIEVADDEILGGLAACAAAANYRQKMVEQDHIDRQRDRLSEAVRGCRDELRAAVDLMLAGKSLQEAALGVGLTPQSLCKQFDRLCQIRTGKRRNIAPRRNSRGCPDQLSLAI